MSIYRVILYIVLLYLVSDRKHDLEIKLFRIAKCTNEFGKSQDDKFVETDGIELNSVSVDSDIKMLLL